MLFSRSFVLTAAVILALGVGAEARTPAKTSMRVMVRASTLASSVARATAVVARHLGSVQLNSVYGTPLFEAGGRRIDEAFLNFTGQDAAGRWMLMSLRLAPDGTLSGEDDEENPRPDNYGHHEKPGLDVAAWTAPEAAVVTAVGLHPVDHAPLEGISFAYTTSKEHQGRAVMVFYWLRDKVIHDVILDAKYGDVLGVGETAWPNRGRRGARVEIAPRHLELTRGRRDR